MGGRSEHGGIFNAWGGGEGGTPKIAVERKKEQGFHSGGGRLTLNVRGHFRSYYHLNLNV